MRTCFAGVSKLWFVLSAAACTAGDVRGGDNAVDEEPAPGVQTAPSQPVDEDGDGIPDGIDLDGDGVADIDLDDLAGCEPLIDDDGDGEPDAVDLDCDGVADLDLADLEDVIPEDVCIPELIAGGVDLDCDGVVDVAF